MSLKVWCTIEVKIEYNLLLSYDQNAEELNLKGSHRGQKMRLKNPRKILFFCFSNLWNLRSSFIAFTSLTDLHSRPSAFTFQTDLRSCFIAFTSQTDLRSRFIAFTSQTDLRLHPFALIYVPQTDLRSRFIAFTSATNLRPRPLHLHPNGFAFPLHCIYVPTVSFPLHRIYVPNRLAFPLRRIDVPNETPYYNKVLFKKYCSLVCLPNWLV